MASLTFRTVWAKSADPTCDLILFLSDALDAMNDQVPFAPVDFNVELSLSQSLSQPRDVVSDGGQQIDDHGFQAFAGRLHDMLNSVHPRTKFNELGKGLVDLVQPTTSSTTRLMAASITGLMSSTLRDCS